MLFKAMALQEQAHCRRNQGDKCLSTWGAPTIASSQSIQIRRPECCCQGSSGELIWSSLHASQMSRDGGTGRRSGLKIHICGVHGSAGRCKLWQNMSGVTCLHYPAQPCTDTKTDTKPTRKPTLKSGSRPQRLAICHPSEVTNIAAQIGADYHGRSSRVWK